MSTTHLYIIIFAFSIVEQAFDGDRIIYLINFIPRPFPKFDYNKLTYHNGISIYSMSNSPIYQPTDASI